MQARFVPDVARTATRRLCISRGGDDVAVSDTMSSSFCIQRCNASLPTLETLMFSRLRFAVLLTLVCSLVGLGCGGSSPSENTTSEHAGHHDGHGEGHGGMDHGAAGDSTAALVPWKDAVVGDRTTCPVSNEEFVVAADSAHAEHEGHTYYFCCADCVAPFEADPARFLNPT